MGPRPELKYYDFGDFPGSGTVAPVVLASNVMTLYCINTPIEGASACQRIGRRINMKSVLIRIQPYQANSISAVATQEFIRVALVYDSQVNGTAPAASDMFAMNLVATAVVNSPWSPVNLNNRDRFLVLKEWFWGRGSSGGDAPTLAATQDSTLAPRIPKMIKWYVKLKGLETTYRGTTGTTGAIGDISTGALYLIFLGATASSAGVVQGANCSLNFNVMSRLRFYD